MSLSQEMRKNFEAELAADYEEKFKQSDLARRKLHNLVQELRGNVRVYARVRPFLPNDGVDFSKPIKATITVRSDEQTMKIVKPGQTEGSGRPDEFTFTFDKAFGPSASQENVFMEVSELVQSALDGYHVCLFSYGQTGSGKVFLMYLCYHYLE